MQSVKALKGMVSIIPLLLYFWGKRHGYKLDDRKGASSSHFGCGVEEKILGIKNPTVQIRVSHFTNLGNSCIKIIPNSKNNLHSYKL
jgi:hypothetical protein